MNHIDRIDGKEFYIKGNEQLGNLLIGEEFAKLGMLAACVAGVNVVFVGDPGGGKTTLGIDAPRMIRGIETDEIADIPSLADLTPKQTVGGKASMQSVTETAGSIPIVETRNTDIPGIIKPTTKWIFANEFNRTAPHSVNSMLEAIENRTITNTAGTHRLDDLQVAVATMNPGEVSQNTFRMTHALASRFPIGAILGADSGQVEDDLLIGDVLDGWVPRPDNMNHVISLDNLKNLRIEASRLQIPEGLKKDKAVPAVKAIVEVLKTGNSIREASPRIARQVGTLSRAIALLRAEKTVTEAELSDSIRFIVTARLGILASEAAEIVPDYVNQARRLANIAV